MAPDRVARAGLAALLLLFAVSGCATRAYTDSDPNARFDRYRSFAWFAAQEQMAEAMSGQADPLLLRRIREAIENGLVAKGYQKVEDRESADFLVSFSVGSRERLQPQSQVRIGIGSYGRYGGWSASAPVATQSYAEGTLAIDVFDGESRKPVFHGWAARPVKPSMDRAVLVDDVVGAILAKFPPER